MGRNYVLDVMTGVLSALIMELVVYSHVKNVLVVVVDKEGWNVMEMESGHALSVRPRVSSALILHQRGKYSENIK